MRLAGPTLALSGNDGAGLTSAEFKAVIAPIYITGVCDECEELYVASQKKAGSVAIKKTVSDHFQRLIHAVIAGRQALESAAVYGLEGNVTWDIDEGNGNRMRIGPASMFLDTNLG